MLPPGHDVWGGRGPAWAGTASAMPLVANAAAANAAIRRFMIWSVLVFVGED